MNDTPRTAGPDDPTWINGGRTLKVRRADLDEIVGKLPPEVEMRVLSILREAKHDIIQLTEGDGPYNVTRRDLTAVAEALQESGGFDLIAPRRASGGRPRNYGDCAGPNVPMPQRLRRDRLLELLRGTPRCLTASELTELMAPREEHPYPYGMCCDDLNELERYRLVRFYPGVPKLWEAVRFTTHPDIRPEMDTQDDDDVWRRKENVKRVLTERGVRLHDSVIEAIVEAACDPKLRPQSSVSP